MKQLTIRGFDEQLANRIRRLAKSEGISLNRAVLRLLRKGAGLGEPQEEPNVVGDSLDHLMGTWSEEEARAFDEAIESCEMIDEDVWR